MDRADQTGEQNPVLAMLHHDDRETH
jgi:hypothetical protein